MNTKRLLISIIVVFLALSITDFLIHAVWLKPLYGATKELWRPEAEMNSGKYMAWLHAGHLLAAITFTTLWAVGFAQSAKASCAVKYGLFMALYGQTHTLISYAVQPFTLEIVWKWIVSSSVQGILLGLILYKVFKPKTA